MDILEKTSLLGGHQNWTTHSIPDKGIKARFLTDGPHGLRKAAASGQSIGLRGAEPSTAFPTGSCLGNTFNPELAYLEGKCIAEECRFYKVNILLGPAICLDKNPLCGRNFEYLSEDPILSGKLGAAWIRGVEDEGIGTSVKHFICNNEENYRFRSDSVVDERALHELYFRNFEIAIKEGKPATVMCSYNAVNGVFLAENKYLLTDVLRKKWGFDGVVRTDWGANHNRVESLKAGTDLERPGDYTANRNSLIDQSRKDPDLEKAIDVSFERIKRLHEKYQDIAPRDKIDVLGHASIALQIALEGAVLLKNDNGALPLKKNGKYCIIGEFFEKRRYQGSGSSLLNPIKMVTPKQAFDKENISYAYAKGFSCLYPKKNDRLREQALQLAKAYDSVLLFLGLDEISEREANDRTDRKLPLGERELLKELIRLGKKVNIILFTGSPVELIQHPLITSILDRQLPGERGGEAVYRLLFGEDNPSGRLSQTWPKTRNDIPFVSGYSRSRQELYKEGIFVGYRYYLSHPEERAYPFGFGLSYTSFAYSDLIVTEEKERIHVSVKVKNTGSVPGKEVIQVYLSKIASKTYRPLRELKSYKKTRLLMPGEEETVDMAIEKEMRKYYETSLHSYLLEDGGYKVLVGCSSRDIRLEAEIAVHGETCDNPLIIKSFISRDIKKITDEEFEMLIGRPIPKVKHYTKKDKITLDTRIDEFHGCRGKFVRFCRRASAKGKIKKARKEKDELLLMDGWFIFHVRENSSIRSLCMSSGGIRQEHSMYGLLYLARGNIFKAIYYFLKKDKPYPYPDGSKK